MDRGTIKCWGQEHCGESLQTLRGFQTDCLKRVLLRMVGHFIEVPHLRNAKTVENRHDHIYAEVNDHLILTNKLREGSAKKLIQGARLVLCTVSMLSNPDLTRVFRLVPMRMLVVDEASQVGIFNYLVRFSFVDSLEVY